jgi:ribokinase
MAKILVAGNINLETTLQIEAFPITYNPVNYAPFGISSRVSAFGYNTTKALTTLGDRVNFLGFTGPDLLGELVKATLSQDKISAAFVVPQLSATTQSVILFDKTGQRQINTDLKDFQQQTYPPDKFKEALSGCELAIFAKVNFTRPLLGYAKAAGVPIATDLQLVTSLEDEMAHDFMQNAEIIFMSHEKLPCSPEDWVRRFLDRYRPEIIVVGLGAEGVLLSVRKDNFIRRFPAVYTRPVVNTIGAGDALFAAFNHFYCKTKNPYESIQKAQLFASYKIGANGASAGFLDEQTLDELLREEGTRMNADTNG